MQAPVARLTKKEIIYLANNKCRHSHSYLSHYQCYVKDNPKGMRVGFFDIEATGLKADYSVMLSYCIKPQGKSKIIHSIVTKKEMQTCFDKRLVKDCVRDIQKFDLLITYFGTGYDLKYIRTRAAVNKIPYPVFGQILHKDVYYMVRNRFCLSRNSMENACNTILGHSDKTHLSAKYWLGALQGDKKSLDYILKHNKADVRDLEKLYNAIMSNVKDTSKSI